MTNTARHHDDLEPLLQFGLHDRLAKAMKVADLNNEDMAEALGVSTNTIGNYTSGRTKRVSKLVLREWAIRTGVPLVWIETGQFPHDSPKMQPLDYEYAVSRFPRPVVPLHSRGPQSA